MYLESLIQRIGRRKFNGGVNYMELIMLRKNILLFFFLVSFVTVSFGQDKQITNDKYRFTLNYPNGLLPLEDRTTILEFRGTKKNYGEDALFFFEGHKNCENLTYRKT